jgi:hypothetical protein
MAFSSIMTTKNSVARMVISDNFLISKIDNNRVVKAECRIGKGHSDRLVAFRTTDVIIMNVAKVNRLAAPLRVTAMLPGYQSKMIRSEQEEDIISLKNGADYADLI